MAVIVVCLIAADIGYGDCGYERAWIAAGERYLIETRALEANARLMKMSVIENTIPKTIPVTTVFMEDSLVGPQSQKHVKRLFEFIVRGVGIVKHLFELSPTYPLLCRLMVWFSYPPGFIEVFGGYAPGHYRAGKLMGS